MHAPMILSSFFTLEGFDVDLCPRSEIFFLKSDMDADSVACKVRRFMRG